MSTPPPASCGPLPSDIPVDGLALIHMENLSKRFLDKRDVAAVQQVHAAIAAGEITAIIGESGSGKSTLLRLIYGLLQPDEGEVRYKGWKVPGPLEKLIPGHEAMRMVSQHFEDLNTYASVWDNVASKLSNTDLHAKEEKTTAILHRLNITQLASQRVSDLSGGERQRVAIARALVTGPEVLLMDEPFNQVDASFRDKLQQDIRRLVDDGGLTVVLVSHDPAEVLAIADALLILQDGRVVASGEPAAIYQHPPNAYAASLLAKSNILTQEEAKGLGLVTQGEKMIAIHPEWIIAEPNLQGEGLVRSVFFKGFYEELAVEFHQKILRVINIPPAQLKPGDHVDLRITNRVTF